MINKIVFCVFESHNFIIANFSRKNIPFCKWFHKRESGTEIGNL